MASYISSFGRQRRLTQRADESLSYLLHLAHSSRPGKPGWLSKEEKGACSFLIKDFDAILGPLPPPAQLHERCAACQCQLTEDVHIYCLERPLKDDGTLYPLHERPEVTLCSICWAGGDCQWTWDGFRDQNRDDDFVIIRQNYEEFLLNVSNFNVYNADDTEEFKGRLVNGCVDDNFEEYAGSF